MLRKLLSAAVLATAATAATVAIVTMKKEKKDNDTNDEEIETVHFIDIADDEEKEEELSEEIKEIAALYPYLDSSFIKEQFSRNAVFNEKYPEDTLVKISHKVRFSHLDEKEQFSEIARENGYEIEEISSKEVIVSKKMYATDGALLSDIYNVANQVNCLNGTYAGYQID